jgi:hypothetical protein
MKKKHLAELIGNIHVGNPALEQAAQYAAVANHGYDMYKGKPTRLLHR